MKDEKDEERNNRRKKNKDASKERTLERIVKFR